jgi:hypothetical protein
VLRIFGERIPLPKVNYFSFNSAIENISIVKKTSNFHLYLTEKINFILMVRSKFQDLSDIAVEKSLTECRLQAPRGLQSRTVGNPDPLHVEIL